MIRSVSRVRTPPASAMSLAFWMTGPSMTGSEYGSSTSITSQPASAIATIEAMLASTVGNPAGMQPTSTDRPSARALPKTSAIVRADGSLARAALGGDVFAPLRSAPDAAAPTRSLRADGSLARAALGGDVFAPLRSAPDAAAPTRSLRADGSLARAALGGDVFAPLRSAPDAA